VGCRCDLWWAWPLVERDSRLRCRRTFTWRSAPLLLDAAVSPHEHRVRPGEREQTDDEEPDGVEIHTGRRTPQSATAEQPAQAFDRSRSNRRAYVHACAESAGTQPSGARGRDSRVGGRAGTRSGLAVLLRFVLRDNAKTGEPRAHNPWRGVRRWRHRRLASPPAGARSSALDGITAPPAAAGPLDRVGCADHSARATLMIGCRSSQPTAAAGSRCTSCL
jgi:hypothetical protein